MTQLAGFRQSNAEEQTRTLPAESTPRFLAVEATAEEFVGGGGSVQQENRKSCMRGQQQRKSGERKTNTRQTQKP